MMTLRNLFLISTVVLVSFAMAQTLAQPAESPLNQYQILGALAAQPPGTTLVRLVQQHGIDFPPSILYLRTLRESGAGDPLLEAVRSAKQVNPLANAASRATQVQEAERALRAELQH